MPAYVKGNPSRFLMNFSLIVDHMKLIYYNTLFYFQCISQCIYTVAIIPSPSLFPLFPLPRHFACKRKCCLCLCCCCCGLLHAFCLFIYLFMQFSVFFVEKLLRKIVVQLTWQRQPASIICNAFGAWHSDVGCTLQLGGSAGAIAKVSVRAPSPSLSVPKTSLAAERE